MKINLEIRPYKTTLIDYFCQISIKYSKRKLTPFYVFIIVNMEDYVIFPSTTVLCDSFLNTAVSFADLEKKGVGVVEAFSQYV